MPPARPRSPPSWPTGSVGHAVPADPAGPARPGSWSASAQAYARIYTTLDGAPPPPLPSRQFVRAPVRERPRSTALPGGAAVYRFEPNLRIPGPFGDRFAKIASVYGAEVTRLETEWGRAADPAALRAHLTADADYRAVLLTHNETSTGVTNPIAALAAMVRELAPEALILVDGVSALGAAIHAFWEPVTTTSRPQASISNGTAPRADTPSTRMSAPGASYRTTAASAAIGFVTPVEVSLWVSRTAR